MDKNNKSKKAWYKRFWVWVGIIALLGIIGSIASPDEKAKIADGTSSADSSSAEAESEKTSFKTGEVIEFDGKKVTVNSVKRNWNSGNEYIVPDSGNEYVKVQVTIKNDSDSEASYNTLDWKIQDSKGVIKDIASVGYGTDGALDSGDLAPGGKVAGFLIFEVKQGDKGLTLRYSPSFWSDKKVEIKL